MKIKTIALVIFTLTMTFICQSQIIRLNIKPVIKKNKEFINSIIYKEEHKSIKSINEECAEIKKTIQTIGYINTQFKKLKKINDSTYLQEIALGNKYNTISVNYQQEEISENKLKKELDNSTIISKTSFKSSLKVFQKNMKTITSIISKNGGVFNEAKLTDIKTDEKNLEIIANLQINEKEKKKINNIKIKGYEKFPKKFTKQYLKIKRNKSLNIEELEKKSNKLNKLNFAKEIKKPEILFSKDSTTIYLYVEKRKTNEFDGFLGFSTKEGTNKIELNGNININLNNNLNTGEELSINYKTTENKQKTTKIKLRIPYLINTPLTIQGELEIFKKDSSFTNTIQKFETLIDIRENFKTGLSFEYNKSNTINEATTQDFTKNKYAIEVEHNNYKNTKTEVTLGIGNRTTTNNKTTQQEIKINSEYELGFNKKNKLYFKTNNRYLISKTVLENEYSYIGGINTIRGITENSIPTYQHFIINNEYRINLTENLTTHTVLDYALFKNNEKNNYNKILGFGIGFKLATNKNILSFIIANNKTNNESIKLKETKIHLSLKSRF